MAVHRLRHWPNIETILGFAGQFSTNKRHSDNGALMLNHRLRCWPNIKTKLVQCLLSDPMTSDCRTLIMLACNQQIVFPESAMLTFITSSETSNFSIRPIHTVESRYNAVVGVQETGPRYKRIAL